MGNTVYIDLQTSYLIWKDVTSKNCRMIGTAIKS